MTYFSLTATVTATGEYPCPVVDHIVDALIDSVRSHMQAYGVKHIYVETSVEVSQKPEPEVKAL